MRLITIRSGKAPIEQAFEIELDGNLYWLVLSSNGSAEYFASEATWTDSHSHFSWDKV